ASAPGPSRCCVAGHAHHRDLHSSPTTTLFRSRPRSWAAASATASCPRPPSTTNRSGRSQTGSAVPARFAPPSASDRAAPLAAARSEEHTSELQSRENLVCRLLLEEKK